MKRKTLLIIFMTIGFLFASATNASAYSKTLTLTDDTDDVLKTDIEGNTTENFVYPDMDIQEIKCIQVGQKVTIALKLNDDGEIGGSLSATYLILLITTHESLGYFITYSNEILSSFGGMDPILIMDGNANTINHTDYTVNNNILSVEFNLQNSNEKIIYAGALLAESSLDSGNEYTDYAPDGFDLDLLGMNLFVNAGGSYDTKTGESLTLKGTLEEGTASNYDWLWMIDDSAIEMTGDSPSYTFKIPGTYTGRVYVSDEEGNWGLDVFQVNVTGKDVSSGSSGSNGQPGFELVAVLGAIAISLVILRKRRK